jgi:hypothetical protein
MVLGSPVGSIDFVSLNVNEVVCKASFTLFNSRKLEDPQMELLLLRCCSGNAKMTYWQRTCNPYYIKEQIKDFDMAIDRSIQHILGTPIFGLDRLTAHLPMSMGGLGIPIASLSNEASFVASVGSSWLLQPNNIPRSGFHEARLKLISNGAVIPSLCSKSSTDVSLLILPQLKEFIQKKFMLTINGKIKEDVYLQADSRKKTILTGRCCKGSSYWLTSPPNAEHHTTIDSSAFRLLLKYNMGIPLLSKPQKCPDCQKIQDKYGHHALSCKKSSTAIDKHNSIVNGIARHMQQAKISFSFEAFNPFNETRQRPGDIYMHEFDIYGEAFFDVSVINICADSYISRASKGQLEGSKIRFEEKQKKYRELGPRLKPLVIESTGGWHPFSYDYLKTLADHISARIDKSAIKALDDILTTVSFCLQRNQGAMLVRRCLDLN